MEASATRNEEVVKNDGLIQLQPRYPVSTTTDSNLLEGKWTSVFSSAKPAKLLMHNARFSIGYKPTNPGEIIGPLEGGIRHFFALETVDASRDPYVTDSRTWEELCNVCGTTESRP